MLEKRLKNIHKLDNPKIYRQTTMSKCADAAECQYNSYRGDLTIFLEYFLVLQLISTFQRRIV